VAAVLRHDAVADTVPAARRLGRRLYGVRDVGEPPTGSAADTVPTGIVTAASPCQPSRIAPQSTEIRSPSASTCPALGMPCTICSFTDAQIDAG
jgi:hypothetical protein